MVILRYQRFYRDKLSSYWYFSCDYSHLDPDKSTKMQIMRCSKSNWIGHVEPLELNFGIGQYRIDCKTPIKHI